jgi:hypothetical protein
MYRVPKLDPLIHSTTGVNVPNSWPEYNPRNDSKWLLLNGDNISSIDSIKTEECKMWQAVREIEYQMYGKLLREEFYI